jgi:predicted DNA-binding transcriptional regulator AlpA
MAKIERSRAVYSRLGVGKTTFDENYVARDGSNSSIPGTDIPRLRPVRLGPRAIGFFSDEIDNLIEALRRKRDTAPQRAPKPAVDPALRRRRRT